MSYWLVGRIYSIKDSILNYDFSDRWTIHSHLEYLGLDDRSKLLSIDLKYTSRPMFSSISKKKKKYCMKQ